MLDSPSLMHYDVACLAAVGQREQQEDAMDLHFPAGAGLGYVVLSDGMGGHASGDVASKLVVSAMSEEMRDHIEQPEYLERNIGKVLRQALQGANERVREHVLSRPEKKGMGATLVAPVILQNRLYWISVGDSPLYLMRGDRMRRLNLEHSMARRLDAQVRCGMITQSQAERDPDRHCLTSVLFGHHVPEIDCRERPVDLEEGDVLIVASDGILALDEARIAECLYQFRERPSAEIAAMLLQRITEVGDPEQDNVSVCLVKVGVDAASTRRAQIVSDRAIARRHISTRRSTVQVHLRRSGTDQSTSLKTESEG